MSATTVLNSVAAGVKAAVDAAAITSLGRSLTVYDHEPRTVQVPAVALLGPTSIERRGIDEPERQLGAKAWDTEWDLRLYLDMTKPDTAQAELRSLLGALIDSIDDDETLGAVADDAVIASGEIEIGEDESNRQLLIYRCDLAVRTLLAT